MSEQTRSTEETIELLDRKLSQLKREYEQYFLGTRPREPNLLLGEVRKSVAYLSNTPIQNTALRFKFSSICSRYMAYKRQWDDTIRKIEAGVYERHRFRARIHGGGAKHARRADRPSPAETGSDLYQAYIDARLACGQSADGITRDKLARQLERQTGELRKRFGEDAQFRFRVAVEDGRVRLKAKRLRTEES